MCGIVGVLDLREEGNRPRPDVEKMIAMLHHRGPEMIGSYNDPWISLRHARLSIIDLAGGRQPLTNENCDLWVICNGEFYNYYEIRRALIGKGHCFRTGSDSEILLHLYEETGRQSVNDLLGQFAFALWDKKRKQLTLGRDRFGVRPLFYTLSHEFLLFSSEVKAILAVLHDRHANPRALAQVFTTWAPLPGETLIDGITEVPPGYLLTAEVGVKRVQLHSYWQLEFPDRKMIASHVSPDDLAEAVLEFLNEAVRIRLQADVPVAAYLSGGMDSTLVARLALRHVPELQTFSVAFLDPQFDERTYQKLAVQSLATNHRIIECDSKVIQETLPEVIWHTESPILRLAPVPMFLLSKFVHENGLKVVLTGEGADEFFGGYDIFKEMLIRRFLARQPESRLRPLLLKRLYPQMDNLHRLPPAMLMSFFGRDLQDVDSPIFSHKLRWQNTASLFRLFSKSFKEVLGGYSVLEDIANRLPGGMENWEPLARAQYLEATFFLSTYLLSTQGDRVTMAHAVEGRYPFLDHRLVILANQLPAKWKIRNMSGEKYLIKLAAKGLIPSEIINRPKYPYRAPIESVFAGCNLPEYAIELLSPKRIQESEWFDVQAVQALVTKVQSGQFLSETTQMAFVGVLSYQLFHEQFLRNSFSVYTPKILQNEDSAIFRNEVQDAIQL